MAEESAVVDSGVDFGSTSGEVKMEDKKLIREVISNDGNLVESQEQEASDSPSVEEPADEPADEPAGEPADEPADEPKRTSRKTPKRDKATKRAQSAAPSKAGKSSESPGQDTALENMESTNQEMASESSEPTNQDAALEDVDPSVESIVWADGAGVVEEQPGVMSGEKLKHACSHCPKSFSRKRELTTHLYIHRENQNNDCTLCGKTFTTATLLRRHNNAHHKPRVRNMKQFVCNHCAEVFNTQKLLEKHHIEKHVTQKQFECNVCGATFSWAQNLLKHKQAHEVNPHKCRTCQREFVDQTSLRVHVLSNHKPPHRYGPLPGPTNLQRSFVCSICGRGFQFDFSYRAHMEAHIVPAGGQAPPQVVSSAVGGTPNGALPVDTPQYVTVDQEGIIDLGILSGAAGSSAMNSNSNEIVIEVYNEGSEHESHNYPVAVSHQPASKRIEMESEGMDDSMELDYNEVEGEEEETEGGGGESIEEFRKSLDIRNMPSVSDSTKERQMFPRVNQDYCYIPVKKNTNKRKVVVPRQPVPFLFDCVMTNETPFRCDICGMSFRWYISLDIHYNKHFQANSTGEEKVEVLSQQTGVAEKQILRKKAKPRGTGTRKTKYTKLMENQSTAGGSQAVENPGMEVLESNIVHKQVASDDEEMQNEDEVAGSEATVPVVSASNQAGVVQQQPHTQAFVLDSDSLALPVMMLSSHIMDMVKSDSTENVLVKTEKNKDSPVTLLTEPNVAEVSKPRWAIRSALFVDIKDSEAIVKWRTVMRWRRLSAWVCHMKSCGRVFSSGYALTRHRLTEHQAAGLECENCPTSSMYFSEVSLSIHRRLQHRKHKLYCLLCGKGFRIGADLCRHRRLHVGGKEVRQRLIGVNEVGSKRHKCYVCGKRYFLQTSLEKHVGEHSIQPACAENISTVGDALGASGDTRGASGDVRGASGDVLGASGDGGVGPCRSVSSKGGTSVRVDHVTNSLRCDSCQKPFRTKEGYLFHQKQCSSSSSHNGSRSQTLSDRNAVVTPAV